MGGYRKNSGHGKMGWYKGYYCQSSWELAWVIYAIDNNIKFNRNTEGFEYNLNDKVKKYYPDFILEDGGYLEIKGWGNYTFEKISQFPYKITVLYKKEIQPILEYVKKKYGNNFINLYEKDNTIQ